MAVRRDHRYMTQDRPKLSFSRPHETFAGRLERRQPEKRPFPRHKT